MCHQSHQSCTRTVRPSRLVGVRVEVWRSRIQLPCFGGLVTGIGIGTSPETTQGFIVMVVDDACTTAAIIGLIVLRAVGIDTTVMAGIEGCPDETTGQSTCRNGIGVSFGVADETVGLCRRWSAARRSNSEPVCCDSH